MLKAWMLAAIRVAEAIWHAKTYDEVMAEVRKNWLGFLLIWFVFLCGLVYGLERVTDLSQKKDGLFTCGGWDGLIAFRYDANSRKIVLIAWRGHVLNASRNAEEVGRRIVWNIDQDNEAKDFLPINDLMRSSVLSMFLDRDGMALKVVDPNGNQKSETYELQCKWSE